MRLAERRGLLRGRLISRVQDTALQMLLLIENRAKSREFMDNLRAAIAANHPETAVFEAMFPEWFPAKEIDPFEGARREDGSIDPYKVDESKIEWKTSTTASEREELEAWIAARGGGVTGAELGGDYQWH